MPSLAPFDNAPPGQTTTPPLAATAPHLRPTKEGLDALVAAIAALQWGDPAAPAFKRVELFDELDLVEAFKRLLLTDSRIALVIYSSETFAPAHAERKLILRRKHELYVVFTDRVMGKRTDALLGTATNPGLLVLRDLILPAITGLLKPQPAGMVCTPTRGSLLEVGQTDSKLPGRLAYLLEVELQGGWLEADIGRSPVW
jgi:hypothetical protein